jgi:ATP-binding cassette subfamily B protein
MLKMLFKLRGWEWVWLLFAVGLIILSTFLDLMLPNYLAKMLDEVGNGADASHALIWLNGGIMMAFAVGSAVTIIVNNFIFAVLSAKVGNRLREEIFNKVNVFGEAEIKKFSVAKLLTILTGDTGQIRNFLATAIQFLIKAPMMAFGAAFMILGKSGKLSAVTFAATGVLLILVIVLVIVVLPKFKSIQARTDDLNLSSRESLTGLRVVRAYNAESYQEKKFNVANEKLAGTFLFVNRATGVFFPFISLLMCGLGLANWWLGSVIIGGMTEGQWEFFTNLSVFTQYSIQIIMSFMFLVFVMIQLPRAMVSARRINEVLSTDSSIVDGEGAEIIGDDANAVEFNGVNFRYPGAKGFVLKGINLQIKQGEHVAFIGSTGCGKSTMINLISRLYDATEGEIKLFGHNIKDYKLEEIRRAVAYIPQTAMLFRGTVRENVAFGVGAKESVTDDEVWAALEIAQAKDFVSKLKGGLDFMVAQHGDNLSGGQKQRIAIARGLVRSPKICIFDDTFSALDFETDAKLRGALRSSINDTVQVVVAQRIGTIKNMHRIVVLEDGMIVGVGTHKELLKSCKVYKEIALSQLSPEELENGR